MRDFGALSEEGLLWGWCVVGGPLVFAILIEGLLVEIQEERKSITSLFWEGGVLRGTRIVNKCFVNKLAFPN